jgi:decaprenyl-phosphate phosphoribosyltransferase
LVFAPAAAAGEMEIHFSAALSTFWAFCVVSSAGYVLNDLNDRKSDSQNSRKKNRPFASGKIGIIDGVIIEASLFLILTLILLGNQRIVSTVFIYFIITSSYTFVFKQVAVVELVFVASGFVIRAIAGGVATSINLSSWFFTVVIFGSLMVVVGKRLAEKLSKSPGRIVLDSYSEIFLRNLLTLSSTGAIFGYASWAFSITHNSILAKISFIPFLICTLRFFWVLDKGTTELSEDILKVDRVLMFVGLMLLVNLGFVFFS